eukprot:TRINITY_DN4548_c0_g1_i1.p1 TRINITY_DN4548_c0_g1~~TRINITY_DN4548_c0_g1_i1.p1  ORF type:complete len:111 (+),score=5.05 TRINITY_DN4548_c0_g1_i1:41-373(+)
MFDKCIGGQVLPVTDSHMTPNTTIKSLIILAMLTAKNGKDARFSTTTCEHLLVLALQSADPVEFTSCPFNQDEILPFPGIVIPARRFKYVTTTVLAVHPTAGLVRVVRKR